ncbi:MAG TPA: ring-cleaving dioxygenase [Conexibacter sp.]|nr:ring-cleaving dioxygenase [Conexibacter sp.]
MQLDGIHHITCITGDAARNVDFYVRVLGLRLAKKTVNQDDPTVYHLFYADDRGSPGADLTFFEYPNARPGRDGAGMIHRIAFRVGDGAALDFWAERLGAEGVAVERAGDDVLRFADPEGLGFELHADDSGDEPLTAAAPDIPAAHALRGFAGVRAYSAEPAASTALLRDVLGFEQTDDAGLAWVSRGPRRGGFYAYDPAPEARGVGGAGTVHHIAWTAEDEDIAAWDERYRAAGRHTSGLVDRFYFRSVYSREPSGVLFEIATRGPGFATDEAPGELGRRLSLPPKLEHLREQIEATLTPLPADPRASRV